ncbi:MAG TPA: DUF5996 family protein [Polyangia bacterium]|jgi:hypothetical protein|nr:DUF5996 family protein [Polyangia bacterium]
MNHDDWPALPLEKWESTYLTLHRWMQIVGKVRLAHEPYLNHWWQVPLYVSSQGLTTSSIPCGDQYLTMTFDFCAHRLFMHTSDRRMESVELAPIAVADFYARVMEALRKLEINVKIWPVPVEVVDRTPFPDDRHHASYDRGWAEKLHRALLSIDQVFRSHRGRFVGKSSPVHFFWGAFDLAVTRFSGRRNPSPPGDPMNREAYSHEVISHGFWPGGDFPDKARVEEAIFYAYAVPEPAGFRAAAVSPAEAKYLESFGEFFLPYEAVRTASNPGAILLDFMETTYLAGAQRSGWDLDALAKSR